MPREPRPRQLDEAASVLGHLLGASFARSKESGWNDFRPDLVLEAPRVVFIVEWKAVGDAANVGSAVRELTALASARGARRRAKTVVPIVAVPYMGETGRNLCAEAGVSWMDLSGNAWIDAPGKQIRFVGYKNRFASVGRPADVFAPRSSRVVRALLMEPGRAFTQTELAEVSGVDKGRVSRLAKRLAEMDLVIRDRRTLRLKDPSLALEAWREAYDFGKHDVKRGHVAVRDPQELISTIRDSAGSFGLSWALTGLAAAWQMTRFAMFRVVTVFVRERPSEEWLGRIGFREDPRGANLWVVRPVDDGVFVGVDSVEGLPCVHPLQVYLDLKAHPERAEEAAAELRARRIRFGAA
jgi:hypothetical protein